jgi:hypothetical protein
MMRRPLLCILVGWLAAGCGARSSVEASSSTAGTAGTGATGGATAAGGATGAGATAAGGTTGAGASTGVGGTTGAGAGGAGGGPGAQTILEACAIAASCNAAPGGWPGFTASACLDSFARLGWSYENPATLTDPALAAAILKCAAQAKGDCAAFQACYGGTWVSAARCREGGQCTGNTMSLGKGASFDCGAIGGTCMELWSNALRACCNAEPCAQVTGVECNGTAATFCGGWGERVDFDCGASGRVCQSGPQTPPQAPCKGTGPDCDPAKTPTTCDGSTALYCSGGALAKQDCSTTQFRTACNQGGTPYDEPCKPAGNACDPQNEPGTCDGAVLRVCQDGSLVGVDCAKVGFAKCVIDQGVARCASP